MNVFYAPFIPTDKGMISVFDCIGYAHEVKEIRYSKLPMFEFCLYRFLIALAMDVYKITDNDLEDLADEGCFDPRVLEDYISKYMKEGFSFELFDEETPFLQAPKGAFKHPEKTSPIAVLNPSYLTGNNPIFYGQPVGKYDKKNVQDRYEMDDAELFACLIFDQMYPVYTGAGYAPCLGGCAAGTPISVLYTGKNLFETILLNVPSMKKSEYENALPLWRNKAGYVQDPFTHPQDILSLAFYPSAKIMVTKDKTVLKEAVKYSEAEKKAKENTNSLFMRNARHLILKEEKEKVYAFVATEDTPLWTLLAKLNPEKITKNSMSLIEDAGLKGILSKEDLHVSIYSYQLISKQKKTAFSDKQTFCVSPQMLTIENQDILRMITDFLELATEELQSVMQNYRGYALEYAKTSRDSTVKKNGSFEYDMINGLIRYEGDKFVHQMIPQVVNKTASIEEILRQISIDCLVTFRNIPVVRNDYYTKSRYTKDLEKGLERATKRILSPPKVKEKEEEQGE